ncbi:hypothetical protein FJ656_12185, partial [Schumannella luteola]
TPTVVDLSAGIPAIVAYLDFADPSSTAFLTANSDLESYLSGGYVTLELHPVALVDTAAGDDYSVRAANALACVAQYAPDSAYAVATAMAAAYPAADTDPPADDALAILVQNAGVTEEHVAGCITDERFRPWVTRASAHAASTGVPGTDLGPVTSAPVILVNGAPYTGDTSDADAFTTFLSDQYTAQTSSDTADGTTDTTQ